MAQKQYENENQVVLSIYLDGRAPNNHSLRAYDIGTILTASQRMIGTIGSAELSRTETPFRPLSRFVDQLPPFVRSSAVECQVASVNYGSFEIKLLLALSWELWREFQNNSIAISFLTSVLANYFTSIATASGKAIRQRFRPDYLLDPQENIDLTYRVLPSLTSLVNKLNKHTGIESFRFSGEATKDKIEWDITIDQNDRNYIQRFADESVAPTGEYRGFLRALDLDSRKGFFVDSYSNEKYELAIPDTSLCVRMSTVLNQEVLLLGALDIRRNVEDRRLRTVLIVQNFRVREGLYT